MRASLPLPVLSVVHTRGLEDVCDEVLVVSLDRWCPPQSQRRNFTPARVPADVAFAR